MAVQTSITRRPYQALTIALEDMLRSGKRRFHLLKALRGCHRGELLLLFGRNQSQSFGLLWLQVIFREAEVDDEDLGRVMHSYQQVVGLEISIDDSLLVDLHHYCQNLDSNV
jgi:hypothetical protein